MHTRYKSCLVACVITRSDKIINKNTKNIYVKSVEQLAI
jgi:hypothetical protein